MQMKDILLLPDLFAIACTALVLIQLRGKREPDGLNLWITGLVLVVAECCTRLLYQIFSTGFLHATMHMLSLEAIFLAGVAFFQSATGRLRFLKHSPIYVTVCAAPHCVLLCLYGFGSVNRGAYLAVEAAGLLGGLLTASILRRPRIHLACHAVLWTPLLVCASVREFRYCAYLSLFFVYLSTAVAFSFTVPRGRRGRGAVVGAFFLWSLCFLSHPWLVQQHHEWLPVAEQIWNLQKFFVTFGLLIIAIDEQMTTNEHHALHDTLTGLPNRRFFEDRLAYELVDATRRGMRLLLFNMDLNNFKEVNDEFGHDAGDQLLRQVSRRLQASVRSADTLARMGGDEFNLLLLDPPATALRESTEDELTERARRIASNLRRAVSGTPYELDVDGRTAAVNCSISIGWSMFPDDGTTCDDLAHLADRRMYADKRSPVEGKVLSMRSRHASRDRESDRVIA